ncbi:hypothetical protein ABL78_3583 [Leptomonas seymouri]|uniref:RRM domain-containing protein n=1 Tax=Leptomonas seymouri TaxID=5684 RepID=A0A0N1IL88_LEPSE|nr:hypothetical protein ABL78_3583 [Leptomonas seymouri]|eukprot:KPI87342.1 hypothetical protein ABL78_3583 [Leptomonas seymouri]
MSEEETMGAKVYHYVGPTPPTIPPSRPRMQYTQQLHSEAVTASTGESSQESLIYWLRGLPFQTTMEDLAAFLANVPAYHRLDMGMLESGEFSGNAFVELSTDAYQTEMEQLHNTFIPCAAHMALPPEKRPRPRFVEVILTTAAHRAEQLREDASLTRAQLPTHRQVQVATDASTEATTAAAAAAAAAAGMSSSFNTSHSQPQDAQQQQPSSFTILPSPQQPQPPGQSYFLIQTNSPMQRSQHLQAGGSSLAEAAASFSAHSRSSTHQSVHSSSHFGESVSHSQSSCSQLIHATSALPQPPPSQPQR